MAISILKLTHLSMTMIEGTIVKWLKEEGQPVTEGEPIVEVETDKVVMPITASATGYLRKILVPEAEIIPVGTALCYLGMLSDPLPGEEQELNIDNDPVEIPKGNFQDFAGAEASRRRISPAAKKLARDLAVEYQNVQGTGPGGLIVKADIERAHKEKALAAIPDPVSGKTAGITYEQSTDAQSLQNDEIIPLKGIRKRIAEHLTISKQTAADATTVAEVDMTEVASYRKVLPVSYTTFVVRAAAKALGEYPILNASLIGEEIHLKKAINISVAVAVDEGLVTPVVKNADQKNILTVSEEINALMQKGRDSNLLPHDFEGGTFTVTNSGIFGSLFFTPIINYPQCAILGMGKVADTPVVRKGEIVIAPMMYLCLTYDHRLVDGAPAVKFLQRVKYYLENPRELI